MSTIADRFRLDGRVALVTGASSGLGRHFARTLAAAGAEVAVAARRMDRLQELAAEIAREGGRAEPIRLDVTEQASVSEAVAAAEAALGPIRILVNNAGVPSGAWFTQMPDEEWRRVLAVNLDGVFRVGQTVARRMQGTGAGGAIINIASILGFGVLKTLSAYATSKAAVIQLTRAMALELARDGIRVNALAPGYIATELNADFLAGEQGRRLLRSVPLRRAGRPDELDGPLLLLASDAGSLMTGAVITVDGGHLLALG